MKTYKLILMVTFVAMSLLANPAASRNARVYDPHSVDMPAFVVQSKTATGKINIMASNLRRRPTTIWLEDEQGKVLFKAKVSNRNTYGRRFDLSDLNQGIYRLIIEQGEGQRIVEPIPWDGGRRVEHVYS